MSIYDKSSLVLIPSGTKTGKVYSQKPTNGDGDFTFTRSSAATRVNADGNIEKETSNLLLQSNSFNTTWLNAATTETSGQAGYDGTNDAWRIDKSNSGAYIYQNISQSGVQTFSVYAKAGTSTWIQVVANGSSNALSFFDLDNGVLGATSSNIISRDITSAGNGYYRCSISVNIGTIARVRFYVAEGDNDTSATSGNIYIQDAQLNQGLIAQKVITTTTSAVYGGITDNVPRLDYTDSSCPALLLEPQRTNIVPDSEYIVNWSQTNATTASNQATSPEGVDNASLSTATGSGAHAPYDTLSGSVTSGANYTMSIFYKKGTTNYLRFEEGYTGIGIDIDIDAESATPRNGATNANIEDYGSGWYRASFGFTGHGSSASQIVVYIKNNNDITSYTASGENIYLYGAQIEAGSYATSYIPTYGSSVSRVAESCSKTSATDLIGQNEGSFYAEIDFTDTDADQMYMTLSDGTSNNRIHIGYDYTSDFIYCNIRAAGSAQGLITTPTSPSEGIKKIAVAYAQDDYVMYINGTQVGSDGNANVPTLNRIDIGNYWTTGYEYPVKQNLLFKTRLSNQELADLTTL